MGQKNKNDCEDSVCLLVSADDSGLMAQHGRRCSEGGGRAQLSAGLYHVPRGDVGTDSVLSGSATSSLLSYQTSSCVVP